MGTVHLVCNAHIDPVWLWEWEEGAAAAISTFRTAADLCEEFPSFVFNHNESLLYRWVEEYEPRLFERIRALAAQGRWRVMGGWYLQSDCNMPSGESFVRQALEGRRYFRERFGVEPATAVNVDPFGHGRGLVQILRKLGYGSYVFCRPPQADCPLPADDFIWRGYDGSEIAAHRASEHYNSFLGKARDKVEAWLAAHPAGEAAGAPGMVLWGIGDHGGGPSRRDIEALDALIGEGGGRAIRHASCEEYFAELAESGQELPVFEGGLNPWGVGCYTSQCRIKQRHRLLEARLYGTEKIASAASIQGLADYPAEELREAARDLLFSEFHDILPGSAIRAVEESALRGMDHGLEILSRLRARAFFALTRGERPAAPGEIPILVYNPHPWPVRAIVECELQLEDQNYGPLWSFPRPRRGGAALPSQLEQEASNINLDWRKKIVFEAELAPSSVSRFDCRVELLTSRPRPAPRSAGEDLTFDDGRRVLVVDGRTGLVARYAIEGREYLEPGSLRALVMADDEDPWGMRVSGFRELAGAFEPAAGGPGEAAATGPRVIEEGESRSVVEALFSYGSSSLVLRYRVPAKGDWFEVEVELRWAERDRMLKLSLPTPFKAASYLGQTAYGREELAAGREVVAQSWTAVVDGAGGRALSVLNAGSYGSDYADGEARLSLLRSPAYAAHPIEDRPIVAADRRLPRIDQGERHFLFRIQGGDAGERLAAVEREALEFNEAPFALSFFPPGLGEASKPLAVIGGDGSVVMCAFKRAESGARYVARLFEPTGRPRTARLELPALGIGRDLEFGPFEIKTLLIDPAAGSIEEGGMLDELGPRVGAIPE
jgi:alpha-mannosidase